MNDSPPASASTPSKRPRVGFGERAFYSVCRSITVGTSRLYYPGLVYHRDRLPRGVPYVLAPVHRSYVDWLIVARVTHHRLRYIVKGEVWKVRAAGRLLEMLGAFPVKRGAPDREAVHRALEALQTGEPLVMFPEGTRRSGPRVEELREGAAYVALRAGVPIVPVGISGPERSMPRGKRVPRPVRTKVVIGHAIVPHGQSSGDAPTSRVARSAVHELTEALRQGLQEALEEAEAPRRHAD